MRVVRLFLFAALTVPVATAVHSQVPPIVSVDVDHFWQAYDKIRSTNDPGVQEQILKTVFLDQGTPGLAAFMEAKGYTSEQYLQVIRNYPRFWTSIRLRTVLIREKSDQLAPMIERFRSLYPALRPAQIYFEIGCLRSGGTTQGNKVLIGTELITGDSNTDVSELPERLRARLTTYFHSNPLKTLVLTDIHEYVHTQEKGPGKTLLSQSLYEGAAEVVAEQVAGSLPPLPLYTYGPAHKAEILEEFVKEMNGLSWDDWLYNDTSNRFGTSDLGYFVGYSFWKDFYDHAADKKAAIAQMIDLDYTDTAAVNAFLQKSNFFQ